MGRSRRGSIWRDRSGTVYARVSWVEGKKRRERKRLAKDVEHARSLCADMLLELSKRGRIQSSRKKIYRSGHRWIYCIQIRDGAGCPIKIGITNNVEKRIKNLLTHLPYEVELLASWAGNVRDEQAVHALFAEQRIVREWFRPDAELLNYIASKIKIAA